MHLEWSWIDNENALLWWEFELFGDSIADGEILVAYASFEDPDNFGNQLTFTCSTEYSSTQDYSPLYEVRNYYGELSFRSGTYGTYHQMNASELAYGGWVIDNRDPQSSYKSNYMDGETHSQKCSAAHIFTKDDPIYAMDIRMHQFYRV